MSDSTKACRDFYMINPWIPLEFESWPPDYRVLVHWWRNRAQSSRLRLWYQPTPCGNDEICSRLPDTVLSTRDYCQIVSQSIFEAELTMLAIERDTEHKNCNDKIQTVTYFIPIHWRVPLPKLTRYLSRGLLISPFGKIHLSGRNFSGEGKISRFWRMKYVLVLTGVCVQGEHGQNR